MLLHLDCISAGELIEGFDEYCNQQGGKAVAPFDLMCWALCCGRVQLSCLFWERTASPVPLINPRVALD